MPHKFGILLLQAFVCKSITIHRDTLAPKVGKLLLWRLLHLRFASTRSYRHCSLPNLTKLLPPQPLVFNDYRLPTFGDSESAVFEHQSLVQILVDSRQFSCELLD